MSDTIESLRARRSAALGILETETNRLHALGKDAPRSGTLPPGWYEQVAALSRAHEEYERANTAYQEAMRQQQKQDA